MDAVVDAPAMSSPTIVVMRFGAVGDVVLTTPALEALRGAFPDARILYAVKEAFACLIEKDPHIDGVIPLKPDHSTLGYASILHTYKPNIVLDLHGKMRSKLLCAMMTGAKTVRWTKRHRGQDIPVRLGIRPYHAQKKIAHRYHDAVESLAGRSLPPGKLRYTLDEEDQQLGDKLLREAGIDNFENLVGISAGANWFTKRWPLERFVQLTKRCEDAGYPCVLTGSPDERSLAATIKREVPGAANLAGKAPLRALAGIIRRCHVFVANDTGPMHIARALGVPTLAFFGSTDPAQFDFSGHHVMFADEPCSPCHFYGRKRCPRVHFRCMTELSVDDAWKQLQRLLSGSQGVPLVAG